MNRLDRITAALVRLGTIADNLPHPYCVEIIDIVRAAIAPNPPATTKWEELIRAEAAEIASRENACSGCCGQMGTETWLDYEEGVREHFTMIGLAYLDTL